MDELALRAVALQSLVVSRYDGVLDLDLTLLVGEQTVRGQFVRDVLGSGDFSDDEIGRVLIVGLRALAGQQDLGID